MAKTICAVAVVCWLAGCGPTEDASWDEGLGGESYVPDELEQSESALCGACDNCVDYVRCRQPSLPHGLTEWAAKRNLKNSDAARRGCVAIIFRRNGGFGHLAYVTGVNRAADPNIIRIAESNWSDACHSHRSGTKAQLGIYGFWCPR